MRSPAHQHVEVSLVAQASNDARVEVHERVAMAIGRSGVTGLRQVLDINIALDVDNLRIIKGTDDLEDTIDCADVRQEGVAKTSTR